MSTELNDLIHSTTALAMRSGIRSERYRILKILTDLCEEFDMNDTTNRYVAVAVKRIMEESNAGRS